MVANTAKQAKPSTKIFQNSGFLRPGWHDDQTITTLYLIGFMTLLVSSFILGVSIGGFWGIVLLVLGSSIFPALMLAVVTFGFYLHFNWPFNIVSVTALLATVGTLVFGISAAAALGMVAWLPLAVAGALSAGWAMLFDL